jgi:Flp pilus assembly protein TadB
VTRNSEEVTLMVLFVFVFCCIMIIFLETAFFYWKDIKLERQKRRRKRDLEIEELKQKIRNLETQA